MLRTGKVMPYYLLKGPVFYRHSVDFIHWCTSTGARYTKNLKTILGLSYDNDQTYNNLKIILRQCRFTKKNKLQTNLQQNLR